jgi:hypothetical protein
MFGMGMEYVVVIDDREDNGSALCGRERASQEIRVEDPQQDDRHDVEYYNGERRTSMGFSENLVGLRRSDESRSAHRFRLELIWH